LKPYSSEDPFEESHHEALTRDVTEHKRAEEALRR
jgi:hypothetical protein